MKQVLLGLILLFILSACSDQELCQQKGWGEEFWQGDTFVQTKVDASKLDKNIIRANISGKWQMFEIEELPQEYLDWSFGRRIQSLDDINKGKMPSLAGPHNGIVATYGYQRADSQFKLNNAVKGMGYLPKPEKMVEVIELLQTTIDDEMPAKLNILKELYQQGDETWDTTKQVSLELYAKPSRGTQTFLNQMANPISVIVFMDIPTFKLKTISYLLHPENSELTEYEDKVVKFVNLMHSYFHGEFDKIFPAVVYNVVEVYNSSPGTKEGKGTKIE
jgi:hypothetical protein